MSTTEREINLWTLLHDLIFSSPHWILVGLAFLAALALIVALAGLVRRIWNGDRFEFGPVKIGGDERTRNLETSLAALSKDDRLKANVLWMFRERLNAANLIINDGIEAKAVRVWCRGVLTDIVTALSEGGHDRHRASIWVPDENELRIYNGIGFRQEALDNATLPSASIAGTVLRTGKSYKSIDVNDDASFSPKPRSGPSYRSLLAVPIKDPSGRTIAALCVDAEAQGYFDRDHEFFACCFADLIALLVAQVVTGC
jgi:hypothetical protein